MKRRDLFKLAGWSAIAASLPAGFRSYATEPGYSGDLLLTVQVSGGWDVTSFCDPKSNVQGEDVINNWANGADIQQAGNIRYAPFANNAALFDKYYSYMLVINGVDAQTNSHTTGVTHNWSGRLSAGYPTITALAASINGPELPMGYVSGGGYQETARLTRYTSLSNPAGLASLINGNVTLWDAQSSYRHASDLERIKRYQLERIQSLQESPTLTPRQRYALDTFYQARMGRDQLTSFADAIPEGDDLQGPVAVANRTSTLLQQAQVALVAFQTGVSMAADLFVSGFDTHTNHDQDHEPVLAHLADGVDFIWETAEQLGIADRLTVFLTSDFGRTPRYNSSDGKDHWPIGSAIFMRKGASWGNRVIGETDEGHNVYNVSPETLLRDDAGGRHIHPGDVQRALRTLMGIDQHDNTLRFPINTGDHMDFFG